MNCEKCGQPLDAGAAFCGNCGNPVSPGQTVTPSPMSQATQNVNPAQPNSTPGVQGSSVVSQVMANGTSASPTSFTTPAAVAQGGGAVPIPSYAVQPFTPQAHKAETMAIIGLVAGILGIPGSLIPILGLGLGITGIVLSTISRNRSKRLMSLLGIIFSCLAIAASIAIFTYAVEKNAHNLTSPTTSSTAPSSSSQDQSNYSAVSTPCYSFTPIAGMASNTKVTGCNFSTPEGTISVVDFDVDAVSIPTLTKSNLETFANESFSSISADNNFKILTKLKPSTFAGSPAYSFTMQDPANNEYVLTSLVYNSSSSTDNYFLIGLGEFGSQPSSFGQIESTWHWK